MSCSGEIVDNYDENLIQIKPSIAAQLKKAKYGVADHSTVELCHWTKNHSNTKEVVTSTNFMGFQLINAWNFHQLECIVKIVVYIVGGQWNFMIQ